MKDREEIVSAFKQCGLPGACLKCKYGTEREGCYAALRHDVLELLKEPEDKELHLDDLDALVNMIAIKAKAEGRFFSPYEVGLALVQRGQHDERFKWGEIIKYSPCEVEQILNEVSQDGET